MEGQGSEPQEAAGAVKPDRRKAVKQANKLASKLVPKPGAEAENLVGVTIKIPEEKRIWWNVQAKPQRTALTNAIIEALDKRFGEPKF
jgi:hypothetical protein